MPVIACYLSYLAISIAVTTWVACTLHSSGRIFLVDAFSGNQELADSVNRLLVVGFYLINVGYIALASSEPSRIELRSAVYWRASLVFSPVIHGVWPGYRMVPYPEGDGLERDRRSFQRSQRKDPHPVGDPVPVTSAAYIR